MKKHHALLLYDSARMETAVGMRSSLGSDRTLIFRSEGLTLDLLVHTGRKPPAYLHGQMIQDHADLAVAGARIRLEGGEDAVDTDEHGEFSISTYDPQGENLLCIEVHGREMRCRIPSIATLKDPG